MLHPQSFKSESPETESGIFIWISSEVTLTCLLVKTHRLRKLNVSHKRRNKWIKGVKQRHLVPKFFKKKSALIRRFKKEAMISREKDSSNFISTLTRRAHSAVLCNRDGRHHHGSQSPHLLTPPTSPPESCFGICPRMSWSLVDSTGKALLQSEEL